MDSEIAELLRRLGERFPAVPEAEIESVVEGVRRRLADRPIQDFVPVLVERAAVEQLRQVVETGRSQPIRDRPES